jgi:uncharacterized membrane protein (UPF0127 family)
LTAAFAALVACSPQAPAQNAPIDNSQPQGSPQTEGTAQTGLAQVPLTIRSANGEHRFTVEVAVTPAQQERGLMFRPSVGPDEGMIFPYDPPINATFWMKNTLVALDMVFIRADGTIARIAHAVPLTLDPVPAGEPVAAVLEIRGGRAAELGIREGDKVSWQH